MDYSGIRGQPQRMSVLFDCLVILFLLKMDVALFKVWVAISRCHWFARLVGLVRCPTSSEKQSANQNRASIPQPQHKTLLTNSTGFASLFATNLSNHMERTITPSKLTGLYKRRTSALGMMNLLVNLPLVSMLMPARVPV